MPNFFDIRTLSLYSGLISTCLFISMAYIYKTRTTYPGFRQWTFAYLMNFLGFLLLSLQGILPDFFTVIGANALILACFTLIARGLVCFAEVEQTPWMDLLPLSGFVLLFPCFLYDFPNINARIVVISLCIAVISLRCAAITHQKITALLHEKSWLLISSFVFVAGWLLLRAVFTVLLEGDIYGFMSAGPMQGVSIIAGQISHIFIALGLMIINAQRMEKNLTQAKQEIVTLRGFLPICSFCKKIRDDRGYWNQLEEYINRHSDIRFSHGICPECVQKHYPGIYDKTGKKT